jgi:hypothetical protein
LGAKSEALTNFRDQVRLQQ